MAKLSRVTVNIFVFFNKIEVDGIFAFFKFA